MPVPANVGSGVFFEDYEIETQYRIRCCYFRQKIRLAFIQKTMKIDKSAEKL